MRITPLVPIAALALLLAACAGPAAPPADDAHDHDHEVELDAPPQPRLAVLHAGGILVLDATTLDPVADVPVDGVTRLAEAGDGRHVMLTTADGFRVLDGGAWTDRHGDHGHSYAAPPAIAAAEFPMDHPGHVVSNYGTTALFSDGDGTVTFLDPRDLTDAAPATRTLELAAPHHGVAVQLSDGVVLVTAGDDSGRRTVLALAPDGSESARTDECPDVHGETVARGEVAVFGCSGAVVVHEAGAFRTLALPDAAAGVGSLVGSSTSSVVLADYGVDGAEATRISLIDVATDDIRVVELPAAYYYWSLALADGGTAVVLGVDGALHLVDTASGDVRTSIPVIDAWTPPSDWRAPAPSVTVLDGVAFVTDPTDNAIHAIDLASGEALGVADLGSTVPHSLALVRG